MIDGSSIALAIAVGLGATLFMDLCALLLNLVFNVPVPNMCLVGRWVRYMPDGKFTHDSLAKAASKSSECLVGWVAHYVIGVIFAVILVLLVSPGWLQRPTILPALIFGVVTVAVPFLVMHPSFGMGIAAARTPNPAQARLRSLVNHAVFGLGLYVSALLLSATR